MPVLRIGRNRQEGRGQAPVQILPPLVQGVDITVDVDATNVLPQPRQRNLPDPLDFVRSDPHLGHIRFSRMKKLLPEQRQPPGEGVLLDKPSRWLPLPFI